MPPRIIFHLTPDGLANWQRASRFEFYQKLSAIAKSRGIEVLAIRMQQSQGYIRGLANDGDLHFVHGGSVLGMGWLNSSLAYLPGYWHVNRTGILANSPAKDRRFESHLVKREPAEKFAALLRSKFAEKRRSRYKQISTRTSLPRDCIAVFLQGKYPYVHKQSHMSMKDMIVEVLHGKSNFEVVIKPHPLEKELGMRVLEDVKQDGHTFVTTDANVHDILEAASVVVSVNSSVSFEGFMHEKPSIVFGRTDFSSLVESVSERGGFSSALSSALERSWDFSGMLYWYFKENTIEIRSRRFERQLYSEVSLSGVDPTLYKIFDT